MVRKMSSFICAFALIMAFAMPAHGASHEVYEGTISSTYKTYAKEILDSYFVVRDYVFFRSGQYEYTLIVDAGYTPSDYWMFSFDENDNLQVFSDVHNLQVWTITTSSGSYNNNVSVQMSESCEIDIDLSNKFAYGTSGTLPTIIPKNEVINYAIAITLCVMLCMLIINRIFFYRKR